MLPPTVAELCLRVEAGGSTPRYLTERDLPWVSALLEVYRAFHGERRALLRERLREPLPVRAPYAKLRVLEHLLEELAHDRVRAALPPVEARWLVFRTATQFPGAREEIFDRAAAIANVGREALEAALFADLASERRVGGLPETLSPAECIFLANRALVSALLSRAVEVCVSTGHEAARAGVARRAQRLGLICSRAASFSNLVEAPTGAPALYISGPLALFRHTQVYARALAALVPALLGSGPFELQAACRFDRAGDAAALRVGSSDPLGVAGAQLEADLLLTRVIAEFRALDAEWEIEESRTTWSSGATLISPELELFEKARPGRRVQVHILRFWTQRSLESALVLAEQHGGLIWADAGGSCDEGDCSTTCSADDAELRLRRGLFFRKRPDARRLLTWLRERS